MQAKDPSVDAALEGWNELCSALKNACADSAVKLEHRQTGDCEVLIQEKQPPRALRLEYSPAFKKLRYNAGISGWQEIDVIKAPQGPYFRLPTASSTRCKSSAP